MPLVTSSDVQTAKHRLNAAFVGVDASIAACASAPSAGVTAWTAFYDAWKSFLLEDELTVTGELAAGWRMDLVEQYGRDLQGWQAQMTSWGCADYVPPVTATTWQAPPLLAAGASSAKAAVDVLGAMTLLALVGLAGYVAVVYVPPLLAATQRKSSGAR